MDPGPDPLLLSVFSVLNPAFTFSFSFIVESVVLVVLLFLSGFVSGAETAFFAITPAQFIGLRNAPGTASRIVYNLLNRPKRLLATLLIVINFINIAIVVISSLLMEQVFDFSSHPLAGFLIQVVAVTFVIIVFCELMPKMYATQNAIWFSNLAALPLFVVDKLLRPMSWLLVKSTALVDRRIQSKGYDVTVDELTHAIDITSDKNTPEDEKNILKGIARFGNIDVKQIMKPRMDVFAIERETPFSEVIKLVNEHRYSRVPVFEESFDRVSGILYIKDLLPYLDQQDGSSFDWTSLLRPAYFVPASKKINDLLQEFQEMKNHLAIVVDEYGGSSGIVTLEDILEEIVGEINDEFDDDELNYSRLDDRNFVFEGKTLLNDVCRITDLDRKSFELGEEETDTLAGFLLAVKGGLPQVNEVLRHNGLVFTIESADRRRIKRVKVTLPEIEPSNGRSLAAWLLPLGFALLLSGCDEPYNPKPRGYFRITLPEKQYALWESPGCPFGSELPSYVQVIPDTSAEAEPCWMNLEFPDFKATVYLTYKPVNGNLNRYIEDSRTYAYKHVTKASGIDEIILHEQPGVSGLLYKVKGNAASPLQFWLTDSTAHFIRGSLYFYAVPNPDSIAPVFDFVQSDVQHFLERFHWK
ncbi:MAG TPA: gliding motility lipoprotein GldD [Bacteroidia bacterium]|nr:gliding motility lipoprotein GldD [Bacteroidia bacterium]